jgi:hypothetical protein
MDIGDHHFWWHRCNVGMERLIMNQPAFPAMHFDLADNEHGMTLRDYFAAKAMQSLITVQFQTKQAQAAETAYEWADTMMKAREA